MAEFDTSSYPRPQAPQNPLDMLTKVGQVADVLGNIEAGKAVQGAIQPDGTMDQNALAQALKRTTVGSMKAIPTLSAFEQLRNAGHVADQAGLDNFQKRMALVNHMFSGLAAKDNPSIKDVNSIAARVLDPALEGHKYGLSFPVVMNALKQFRGPDGRPLSPAEIKKKALEMQLMTASTSEQLGALSPRYQIVDDGNTIRFEPVGPSINPQYPVVTKRIATGTEVVNPKTRERELVPPQETAPTARLDDRGRLISAPPGTNTEVDTYGRPIGSPQSAGANRLSGITRELVPVPTPRPAMPPDREAMGHRTPTPENALPATFAERFNPRMSGAPTSGLAPGVAEAATSTAQTSAALGNQLVTAAAEVPAVKGILDNLERNLENFTSGPGADWQRVAKGFAGTVLPESWQKEGSLFDPKKVASQEEFNKFAYQLAQRQFQQLGGTGTDSKLSSAMSTSPQELITKEGNKGIIRMLKGNNDALAVQAKEWNNWKKVHGENSYAEFSEFFNQNFNPRVFQFKHVPKSERKDWYRSMSPEDRRQFEQDAEYALGKKWIKP